MLITDDKLPDDSDPEIHASQKHEHITIRQLLPLFDWFIPDSLKQGQKVRMDSNDVQNIYAKTLLILNIYLISIIAVVGTTAYLFDMASTPELKNAVLLFQGGSVVLFIISVVAFKYRYKSTLFLGNAYAFSVFINILSSNFIMGFSFASPNLPLFLFVPTWAFLVCNERSGLAWTCAVTSVFAVLYFIEPLQLTFPQVFPLEELHRARMLAWLLGTALIVTCLFSYQNNFNALNDYLAGERTRFAYQALHDPLTGLANRTLFHNDAEEALRLADAQDTRAALIYIDLDDFKLVNDDYGHQAGDELLKIIADRIQHAVRKTDTAARLGGDEFGIMMRELSEREDVDNILQKLERAVAEPVKLGNETLQISCSLGVGIAPEHGKNIDALMRRADTRMYQAKNLSKDSPSFRNQA